MPICRHGAEISGLLNTGEEHEPSGKGAVRLPPQDVAEAAAVEIVGAERSPRLFRGIACEAGAFLFIARAVAGLLSLVTGFRALHGTLAHVSFLNTAILAFHLRMVVHLPILGTNCTYCLGSGAQHLAASRAQESAMSACRRSLHRPHSDVCADAPAFAGHPDLLVQDLVRCTKRLHI